MSCPGKRLFSALLPSQYSCFLDEKKYTRSTTDTLSSRTLRDLPGPRGLPFVGNALQLDTQRIHLILEDWVNNWVWWRRSMACRPTKM